jgi:diguanylate cyclase (GGDEF)-like protein/PAS domain S-box-containing protein
MLSTIRAKLIAAFLLLIVVPISFLSLQSYQKTEEILLAKAREHSLRTMQNARTFFIEEYITKMETTAERLARDPELRRLVAGSPQAGRTLADWDKFRSFDPGVAAVYFGSSEGQFFLSSLKTWPLPTDVRSRPWYKKAVENMDDVVWTEVYLDTLTNQPVITTAKAVADGKVYGVLAMDTMLPVLADIIKKISFEQGGYAILLDSKGQIIGHSDADKLGSHVADENWYWDIKKEFEGSLLVSLDGRATMISFITIPQTGWKLVGFIPEENLERELGPIRARTLGLGLVAAMLAVALGVLFAHDIARRLNGLVAAMNAVEEGDFRARWQDHSSAEFSALSSKFNAMVTTLDNLIHQQQASQQQIALQKVYFEQLFENSPESVAILDHNELVVRVNPRFCEMFGFTAEEAEGRALNELIVPDELADEGSNSNNKVINANKMVELETLRRRKDGSMLEVMVIAYPIIVMGRPSGGYAIYRDISERKEVERRLTFTSTHDLLTGVYNRRYFEQEMDRLETVKDKSPGIIIADIDGLKLVNDTLGHTVGDSMLFLAAVILRENLPEDAVLCRIGGDEFAALLPGTDETELAAVCKQIRAAVMAANKARRDFALSMSLGYAVKSDELAGMREVYREADGHMYREKLQHSGATRSALVKTLTEALHAKEYITEDQDTGLQELVIKLAQAADLPEKDFGDLRLLAQFHDVGKVGVPDNILFKPDKLTAAEMRAMRRHSEVGYRIAVASPDFHHIADWILKHHEWWNGGGYPLGLKGEEIPLECRILLIADAYQAMTHDRPYRKAMTAEAALAELIACRGVMFDPDLVDKFIAIIQDGRS